MHPLPVVPINAGAELQTHPAYDLDGRKRPPRVLFQYTLGGEGHLRFQGVDYAVRPGTAMLLWFPHDHRYRVLPGGRWEHVFLSLGGNEATAAWQRIVARRGPLLPLAADSTPIQLAAALAERMLRGRITTPYEGSALAYQLVMALLEASATGTPDADAVRLERAVDYVRSRLEQGVGVADMARVAGLSRHHFTRVFTRARGVTPVRFLLDLRIATATRLLRDPDRSVREVSTACGFADTSYFCQVFRRAVGVTPASFRDRGMADI